MSLTERIAQDMKAAMKAGDKLRLETLRSLRAGILEFEKTKAGNVPGEEDEIRILTAAAKRRREAIEQYRAAGRTDLADNEEKELAVISAYLPAQLSGDELEALVDAAIAESGATEMKDFGRVMGPLMKKLQGRADGGVVQAMVRSKLGGG
ncbi:MAG: GatB/YqeY domain-containing protein [Bacteroidota bacterium]|nr:GatB/YqeY domain-containing protein [Bacteroidota bacterium]